MISEILLDKGGTLEYFDAMNDVMGAKHSTEPPVVVDSFSDSQIVDDSLGLD